MWSIILQSLTICITTISLFIFIKEIKFKRRSDFMEKILNSLTSMKQIDFIYHRVKVSEIFYNVKTLKEYNFLKDNFEIYKYIRGEEGSKSLKEIISNLENIANLSLQHDVIQENELIKNIKKIQDLNEKLKQQIEEICKEILEEGLVF